MRNRKFSKALKFKEDDVEIVLIGREDASIQAPAKYKRVRDLVTKMVSLGKKRGRPKQAEESNDEAA